MMERFKALWARLRGGDAQLKKIAYGLVAAVVLVVLIGVGKLGLMPVPGVHSWFDDPATCAFCHETWYGDEATFNPQAGAEKPFGVTVGCAECHPSAAEEFRSSAHGMSASDLKPGCVNCHDAPHSVPTFFSHMFLEAGKWKGVQIALRDQDYNNRTLAPALAIKERARMVADGGASCRACHEAPGATFPKTLPQHQAALSGQGSCLDCHANLTHQRSHPVALAGHGDAIRGQALATQPVGPEKKTCFQCHGAGGVSENPEWPSLAGQGVRYVEQRLRALRMAGEGGGAMGQVAATLNDGQIDDLAAYFATPPPKAVEPPLDLLEEARGIEAFARCAGCHGPQGQGQGVFPRIAGQPLGYLIVSLTAYRDGQRAPGSIMARAVAEMDDEAIEQVAGWLATVE